ncbi:helix-turn-helix transcriptional regulator [Sphingomonas abietis]|uniref:AlpA family phage regulatory protein n=1 Tax=Sphingomonas abietis TaxID=3012344 RepID=A0ABY7NVF1_9SPHN|nr:AlpA family phage regulatory protein [Sphingomonas abietis]WBO24628.1 AlpA family phage regulatory protein [Sphingomonas abietis]
MMTQIGPGSPADKDRRKDSLLRIADVKKRTGLSVATIYRREAEGTFPAKQRLGPRSVAWYESDVEDFVAAPTIYRRTA